jgi:hypothetical protein
VSIKICGVTVNGFEFDGERHVSVGMAGAGTFPLSQGSMSIIMDVTTARAVAAAIVEATDGDEEKKHEQEETVGTCVSD